GYDSSMTSLEYSFLMSTDSLDISASNFAVSDQETVRFHVNQDTLDFFNANSSLSSFDKSYYPGGYNVQISWTRATPSASWRVQLDLGRSTRPPTTSTTTTTTTTTTTSTTTTTTHMPTTTTTTRKPTTTSGAAATSLFFGVYVVFM
ncbi:hypothetical protein PMAYCL1PPCAC_21294, partial [Pristionchus mayeri]